MEIHTGESSLQQIGSTRNPMPNSSGFTLVELIMVMAIVGVLASLATSTLGEVRNKTRNARGVSEIRNIEKDIFAYASEKGNYPASLTDIGKADQLDPWGNPYVYSVSPNRTYTGVNINTDFDLYSKGVDGNSAASIVNADSLDDIIRGNDGAFADLAVQYGII